MNDKVAYRRVYEVLKQLIEIEEYAVGQLLPSEPELGKIFSVSRTTIRQAVQLLARDGYVSVKQGKGTEVISRKAIQELNKVTSLSETLRRQGYDVDVSSTKIWVMKPTKQMITELKISTNEPVVAVHRVTTANGQPIAILRNYIPAYMVPGMSKHTEKLVSIYKFLEDRWEINIDSAEDSITARCAGEEEAAFLNVPKGTPLLHMKRTTFSGGKPISRDIVDILGEKYAFSIHLVGRQK